MVPRGKVRVLAVGAALFALALAVYFSSGEVETAAQSRRLLDWVEAGAGGRFESAAPIREISIFRDGKLSRAPELVIASGDTSGGLRVQLELDPDVVYRVGMAGANLDGRTTLRLRGSGGKRYISAPDGAGEWTVDGTPELDVLVYSDAAARYRLDRLSIEPCPRCPVDRDLRALILSEAPEVADDSGVPPLVRARALLDWAANRTDWPLNAKIVQRTNARIAGATASEMYFGFFADNQGAVWCGGSAVFLDKVLRLFGFDSVTINFGTLHGALTHVTVVLALGNGEQTRFFILDPTFNAVFVDTGSERMLSLWQLLERARTPESFATVTVASRSLARRDWLALPDLSESAERNVCGEAFAPGEPYIVCSHPEYSMDHYWVNFAKPLVELGFDTGPRGFFQLLRNHVFSVGASVDPQIRERLVRGLIERGIPVAGESG